MMSKRGRNQGVAMAQSDPRSGLKLIEMLCLKTAVHKQMLVNLNELKQHCEDEGAKIPPL